MMTTMAPPNAMVRRTISVWESIDPGPLEPLRGRSARLPCEDDKVALSLVRERHLACLRAESMTSGVGRGGTRKRSVAGPVRGVSRVAGRVS